MGERRMTAPTDAILVGLVEDDSTLRNGFKAVIDSSSQLRCVLEAGSVEEAFAQIQTTPPPEVVLMDIHLPGASGIEGIRELKRTHPKIQLMMLTIFEDHDRIFQSLEAGASGYLLKNTAPPRLIEAIVELYNGGSPMSAPIARKLVDAFREQPRSAKPASTSEDLASLSPREAQILALLAKGYLYKEIADELKLSVETVRTHLHSVYEKLHVRSRTEAVMKAFGKLE